MTETSTRRISLQSGAKSLSSIHSWAFAGSFVDFGQAAQAPDAMDIACIVGNRVLRGLTPYCNVHLLTPDNWRRVLEVIKPKLLIVESIVISATHDWHLAQCSPGVEQDELLGIIRQFQKADIPVVYWDTHDILYKSQFSSFAQNFETVFFSDWRYLNQKPSSADRSRLLQPACVPFIHNPIAEKLTGPVIDAPVVFDGWADLIRYGDQLSFLRNMTKDGLKIVDSRYRVFRNQLENFADIRDSIWGSVGSRDLVMLQKFSDAVISSDFSISARLSQQWAAVEAAACRNAIYHHGRLGDDDMRQQFAIADDDGERLVERIRSDQKSSVKSNVNAQRAWRHVHGHHTFAHRLEQMGKVLGLEIAAPPAPKISIITATYRMDMVERSIRQYDGQTYPRKELVLVVNGNAIDESRLKAIIGKRKDIKPVIVPAERVEAGSLNHAIALAGGEYVVKMDDDDIYGPHYAGDLILHACSANLDLFGKSNRYFYFEDDDAMYFRRRKTDLSMVPSSMLLRVHIGGATLSGKTSFFRDQPYPEMNFAATDTHFYGNIEGKVAARTAVVDDTGFIYFRRGASHHSWKIDNDKLKSTMEPLSSGMDTTILG